MTPVEEATAAKLLAEAEKFKADAAKAQSEAAHSAGLAALTAEALTQARIATAREQMKLNEVQRAEKLHLASNYYHHTYYLTEGINGESVGGCFVALDAWHRTEPDCAIELVIASPGGEIVTGMALYDKLRLLSSQGHHITIRVLGIAASMAAILLQAGDHRIMGKSATLMIHEGSLGASGKVADLEDTMEWIAMIQDRIVSIFTDRSGGKLTVAELKKRWKRTDWYMTSDTALKYGLVDEVQG